jgi:8-oxo-dGTP pyrophosphatase MutT (NUDIX family)
VAHSVDVEEDTGRRLVPDALLPDWLSAVVRRAEGAPLPRWVLHATDPAPGDARRGAVLMLLAEGDDGPDLVITQRAATLRAHAGQPAFPGGALEEGEDDVAAALREAAEETALDPSGVTPVAVLPQLYLPPSRFVVRPVLAHWRVPSEIRAVDPAETQRVLRVPVTALADPDNRGTVVLRAGGPRGLRRTFRSPAFTVGGLTVWGFTAGLVDLLLEWGGWAVPWDRGRELTP